MMQGGTYANPDGLVHGARHEDVFVVFGPVAGQHFHAAMGRDHEHSAGLYS